MTPESRGRGRPKIEGLAERRSEEILAAATEVFAEYTFRSTDVQVIADRLGVGKGTIYRYFPSKDELFLAAVSRGMDHLRDAVDPYMTGDGPPRERLRAMTGAFLRFFDANPDLVELLVQERSAFRDRGRLTFFDHKKTMMDDCSELKRELHDGGHTRHDPDDPVHDDAVTGLLYGVLFSWRYCGEGQPLEARVDAILDVIFHGILNPA